MTQKIPTVEQIHVAPAGGQVPDPGPGLLRLVQVGLRAKGDTLAAVSRRLEVDPRNVAKALLGNWRGPTADLVRAAAVATAGLERAA
jgi:hypothetical protein